MSRKKVILILFLLVALVQIYLPASMILDREATIRSGQVFKFKCQPVDPSDPFRGKYIVLEFQSGIYHFEEQEEWYHGELIYVSITNDPQGFAKISSVNRFKPPESSDWFKASVNWSNWNGSQGELSINFPFDRFYMEESKAIKAEQLYREQLMDSTSVVYSNVSIYEGNAVLTDVVINGISIQKAVGTKINIQK